MSIHRIKIEYHIIKHWCFDNVKRHCFIFILHMLFIFLLTNGCNGLRQIENDNLFVFIKCAESPNLIIFILTKYYKSLNEIEKDNFVFLLHLYQCGANKVYDFLHTEVCEHDINDRIKRNINVYVTLHILLQYVFTK